MKLSETYPMRLVCRLLGAPRSSMYYRSAPAPDADAMFKTVLLDLAAQWPTYGYRRLTAMMRRSGWPVNGKRVRRWMDELGINGTPPQRKRRTTHSRHAFPRYPNLVETLEIQAPDQVWVADITYIRLRREFVYLAVLMDVFTRSIRGWHLSRNLDQGLTLAALERALVLAIPAIHHSDQGLQYAATAYVERLQKLGVRLSMAAVGEAYQNGYAERVIRTIKEEEVYLSDYRDFADASANIRRFLDDVYNVKRIHSALGYLTPQEFEDQWRASQARPTTTQTGAEDRATLASDPSADSGGNRNGAAGPQPPSSHSFPTKALNAPSDNQRPDE
jgi:transposase InsO family protein